MFCLYIRIIAQSLDQTERKIKLLLGWYANRKEVRFYLRIGAIAILLYGYWMWRAFALQMVSFHKEYVDLQVLGRCLAQTDIFVIDAHQ